MVLHLNIEDLLSTRTVELDRIEYKEGWNPDAIYRSICAFANDFDNTGGGYILIGVEEDTKTNSAKRPVKGLTTSQLATIQKEMIGYNNLLRPYYAPKLFIENVDGNAIIVLWVIGGSERPYEVPETITAKHKTWKYFIRKYASSIEAKGADKEDLISLSNNIPFDDRSNTHAAIENVSMVLVKDYLINIKSKLASQIGKQSDKEILGQMELISGPNEHVFPRNVGLMMFAENPEKYFPSTQVEIVEFPEGEANPHNEIAIIKGPIPLQIKRTLEILSDRVIQEKVIKLSDKAESVRIVSYPLQAIEEALVNAFYHRDYQQREPIEIRIYANSLVIINHGGPDRSIKMEAFNTGKVRSRRYRNRRLGEFLKELKLTEGRATGIPTILKSLKDNGSPPPKFDSDDDRTFFEVELSIHPSFAQMIQFTIPIEEIIASIESIDVLLDRILEYTETDDDAITESAIAGVQAGAIAKTVKTLDNQVKEVKSAIGGAVVGAIAGAIAEVLTDKEIQVLTDAKQPRKREEILTTIGVSNHRKNYESYMQPLIERAWLTMTITDKPTSPKQQYITTLKGRLVLDILKHKAK